MRTVSIFYIEYSTKNIQFLVVLAVGGNEVVQYEYEYYNLGRHSTFRLFVIILSAKVICPILGLASHKKENGL